MLRPRSRAAPSDRRRRSARRAAAAPARGAGTRRARAAASSRPRARPRAASRARSRPSRSSAVAHRALAVAHRVHARDEVEVLRDRQVLVEAELLRHVADAALDLRPPAVRMSKPRHVPLPSSGVSRPQSMRMVVVLPLPLGPRKPQMRPRGHREIDVVDAPRARRSAWSGRARRCAGAASSSLHQAHVHRLPRMQLRRVSRRRPRLDQEDELLAALPTVDHRRRELGLRRDVASRARAIGPAQPSQVER